MATPLESPIGGDGATVKADWTQLQVSPLGGAKKPDNSGCYTRYYVTRGNLAMVRHNSIECYYD